MGEEEKKVLLIGNSGFYKRKMIKKGSCFLVILLEVVSFLVNNSICVPVVNLKKSQIFGRTTEFDGYKVNEYLGIRYAQPPVGSLRFQRTKKLSYFPRQLKALNVPPACLQYSESPYPWYVNGSYKSEDCLFLNIWTPVDASPFIQKAVLFWIHGGGFRFGSIQDQLYNGVALAGMGDIIVVTVNYRLGAFGFLTTGTEEAPGNAGLWDVLEALKWVNQNIGYFGGDTSRITIAGESVGSISVGYLSVSPLATNLFSQMIMESGSPTVTRQQTKLLNLALTEQLATKVGCATGRQSVAKCLKRVKAEDLERAEFEMMPKTTADFLPQYGDEFLPTSPQKSIPSGEFRCKKLLIGNNLDEGSLFVSTSAPEIFGFFGEKVTQSCSPVDAELADKLIKSFLPDLQSTGKSPVPENPLLKGFSDPKPDIQKVILDSLLQNAYNSSLHELYTLLGDLLISCPDEYYAEKCAENGGDVYFYLFAHRPRRTPWAPWMGVAHFEEVQFVFGKPLLDPYPDQAEERKLSTFMIKIWSNFVRTGKPNNCWPLYSKENPVFRYIGKRNSKKKYYIAPHKQNCDIFRQLASI